MAAAEILEALMLLSFGAAWPASIVKSWHSRTAKGKSGAFLFIVLFGYICGVGAKFAAGNPGWVVILYFLNLATVGADTALYFRNLRLDARRGREE